MVLFTHCVRKFRSAADRNVDVVDAKCEQGLRDNGCTAIITINIR